MLLQDMGIDPMCRQSPAWAVKIAAIARRALRGATRQGRPTATRIADRRQDPVASAVGLGALLLALVWCLLVAPAARAATDAAPLLYAGFAFSGDHRNRAHLYPISAELAEEGNGAHLDGLLRDRLLKRSALRQRVSLDVYDGKADVSSVAFALVQESAEVQRIEGKHWVIVTMQANVLAFNPSTKSVVASYPVRMRFTRVRDRTPSAQDLRDIVREAYTSPNPAENVFDRWVDRLEKLPVRQGAVKRLRVTAVDLSPEALRAAEAGGADAAALRNQLAILVEGAVAESAGIAVIPSSVGEAIGSKMAFRFANGSEIDLSLPDPDYALSFRLRDFVSKTLDKPDYRQVIYRVKAGITLRGVALDRMVLDENVYDTNIVTLPKRADIRLDDWQQYVKTLQSLITSLGRQLAAPQDAWLQERASRALEAKGSFVAANQVLQELR